MIKSIKDKATKNTSTLLLIIITSFGIFFNTFNKILTKSTTLVNNKKSILSLDKINSLFSKTSQLSEELASIMQYIAQLINTNKIKCENNIYATKWLNKSLEEIDKLKKSDIKINIQYIMQLNLAIQDLSREMNINLINNFNNITYKKLKKTTLTTFNNISDQISIEEVNETIKRTELIISHLKSKAYISGLTKINKITRILDQINDRYHVLPLLTSSIAIAGVATALVYCLDNKIPKKSLTSGKSRWLINPIVRFKNYLGEKPIYCKTSQIDPNTKVYYKEGDLYNRDNLGIIGKLDHLIIRDPDIKAISSIGSTIGVYFFQNEIKDIFLNIKNKISNQWETLKGYDYYDNNNNNNNHNNRYKIEDSLTLDDERLIGLEEQSEQLKKIASYVTEPDIYDKQGINIGKGILLTGPTRTGKTLLAKALSGEINKMLKEKGSHKKFGLKEVSFTEIVWKENSITELLNQAKHNAPCILFIDEIHNLPLQNSEFSNKTLNDFLIGMSGINSQSDSKHQVIMLAATNKPELIDTALLQPGRFGHIIHFDKPNYKNRKKYFKVMLKRNMYNPKEFDLDIIVKQTKNCSYGDLEEILRESRFNARRESKRLNQEHLQNKINSHIHRFKLNMPLNEKEQKIAASYQAGKVLSNYLYNSKNEMLLTSILGQEPKIIEKHHSQSILMNNTSKHKTNKHILYGHTIRYNCEETIMSRNLKDYEIEAKILLSGHIAQKILLDNVYLDYNSKDKNKAISYIKKNLLNNIEYEELSNKEKENVKIQVLDTINKYEKEIKQTLLKNKDKLIKLYSALKNDMLLYQKDINKILKSTN